MSFQDMLINYKPLVYNIIALSNASIFHIDFLKIHMTDLHSVQFSPNPVITARREHYLDVRVNVDAILENWRQSLFSHEWLLPDGRIKSTRELPGTEAHKREKVELDLANGRAINMPILGIGLLDNVEIGSAKAEFLTLASMGMHTMPVHISKSNQSDFKQFIVAD